MVVLLVVVLHVLYPVCRITKNRSILYKYTTREQARLCRRQRRLSRADFSSLFPKEPNGFRCTCVSSAVDVDVSVHMPRLSVHMQRLNMQGCPCTCKDCYPSQQTHASPAAAARSTKHAHLRVFTLLLRSCLRGKYAVILTGFLKTCGFQTM